MTNTYSSTFYSGIKFALEIFAVTSKAVIVVHMSTLLILKKIIMMFCQIDINMTCNVLEISSFFLID